MLKLITLEIRKNKLSGMLKAFAIANLAILAFMILVIFIDNSEGSGDFNTYAEMFEGVYVFVKGTFIIFASVLLSKLVIEEYKSNTITVLFMYPIPRKKLMAAKILIVFLFTLISIFVSDILLDAILLGINSFVGVVHGELTQAFIVSEVTKIGLDALYAAGIGLIPLFFGMRKKSVPATIVSGVLVVSLISSGFDQFRLGNQFGVAISLCLVGVAIAYLSIRSIEKKDIA